MKEIGKRTSKLSLSELNDRYQKLVKEESALQGELKQINSSLREHGVKNPADLDLIIDEHKEKIESSQKKLDDILEEIEEALNAIDG